MSGVWLGMKNRERRGRFPNRWVLVVSGCAVAILPSVASADLAPSVDWAHAQEIAHGVRLAHFKIAEPRLVGEVLRIDLSTPGLRFHATEPDARLGEPIPGCPQTVSTRTETVRDFLSELRHKKGINAVAAVNTTPWTPFPSTNRYAHLTGTCVSGGRVLEREGYPAVFAVCRDGTVLITNRIDDALLKSVTTAASGFSLLLDACGNPVDSPGGARHPRTAFGLSADRQWLYWLTVDGRQPDHSVGATCRELGEILRALGCTSAMNMDGGGSTTLCHFDAATGAVVTDSHAVSLDTNVARRVAYSVAVSLPDASPSGLASGAWWWDCAKAVDPDEAKPRLRFLRRQGVTEVYLCVSREAPTEALVRFIRDARAHGLSVAYLAGDVSWIMPGNLGFDETFAHFRRHQRTAPADARFTALHLDVEPYQNRTLEKARLWQLYADFVLRVRALVQRADEKLEWDIPFWLDEIRVVRGNRAAASLLELVMDSADGICIMSYRDTATAMLDISKEELALAASRPCRVLLGAETGRTDEEPFVSYQKDGKAKMATELQRVRAELARKGLPAGCGTAVHHVESWMSLKE